MRELIASTAGFNGKDRELVLGRGKRLFGETAKLSALRLVRESRAERVRRAWMNRWMRFGLAFAGLAIGLTAIAQEPGVITPQLLLSENVQGMPHGETQQVRVLRASFQPGDRTKFHTHRFPVTLYILEGAFTLEMEGREPITVKAGGAIVMPPNVRMTGYNRSNMEPLRLVIFSVSDPDTPFLDPIQ